MAKMTSACTRFGTDGIRGLSGYTFESALEAGIVSAGAAVMLVVGPLPMPAT